MFLRAKSRTENGKTHRYWSVVENRRVSGRRVVQRQVLYLGELNDNQRAGWVRTIEALWGKKTKAKQLALFPDDRKELPILACETIRVRLDSIELRHPRQWGACWLGLLVWGLLELDTLTLEEFLGRIEKQYGKFRRTWLMDRGIPTEEMLEKMRSRGINSLVGTPKGHVSRIEKPLLEQTWMQAREGVRVKILQQESEFYVSVESHNRVAKERPMRRRRLKRLWRAYTKEHHS
ncbi:MAG: hypothetical protein E3K40_11215 [Candidatus Brocadia sp.]|nr:hypothetical protein [Candidatus Brocadia sp.]